MVDYYNSSNPSKEKKIIKQWMPVLLFFELSIFPVVLAADNEKQHMNSIDIFFFNLII